MVKASRSRGKRGPVKKTIRPRSTAAEVDSGRFLARLAKKVRSNKTLGRKVKRPPHEQPGDFMVAKGYLSSDGLVDVDVVVAQFGVTKAALAQSLGFAEETLQRSSRVAAQKTQQRLREMLEIITRVVPWAGGKPQAMGWYRGQSIPALGDQTAEALVRNDQASIVRRYLDGVAAGSYA
jgi:hypothetical protein